MNDIMDGLTDEKSPLKVKVVDYKRLYDILRQQEALQKKPEIVFQHNAISQSIYDMSVNARRLIAMAMALIPMSAEKPEDYRVVFSTSDFLKSLGIEHGGKTSTLILSAVTECLESAIKIHMPNGDFVGWTWFTECRLIQSWTGFVENPKEFDDTDKYFISKFRNNWEAIVMEFNPKLGAVIKEFKLAYAKLNLINFGKLQSKYAIRFYELAMSYHGFAGKDGNPENTWYIPMTLEEIRKLFAIEQNKYPRTGDFRRFIIDNPIQELNEAKVGIKITPDYLRKGKFLVGVKFICEYVNVKPKKEAKKAIEAKETPISGKREDITPKEIEELRGKYPAEWEKIYEEEKRGFIARSEKIGITEISPEREQRIEEIASACLKKHLGL